MNTEVLRWVLLVIGIVLVVGIYFRERLKNTQPSDELDELKDHLVSEEADSVMDSVADSVVDDAVNDEPDIPMATVYDAVDKTPSQSVDIVLENSSNTTNKLPNELIIVLNIIGKSGKQLQGERIYLAARKVGFKYGEMDIFHCYVMIAGEKKAIFSLANIMEPGSFNLNTIKTLLTPGITLFMQLPGPLNHLAAYDEFVIRARKLAGYLQAELYNEKHELFTEEHMQTLKQKVLQHREQLKK